MCRKGRLCTNSNFDMIYSFLCITILCDPSTYLDQERTSESLTCLLILCIANFEVSESDGLVQNFNVGKRINLAQIQICI